MLIKIMEQVKNIFVSTNCDDDTLVYVADNLLSIGEVTRWAKKVFGDDFNECYEIADEEIQYYCISDRVWIGSKEEADRVREYLAA